MKPKETPEASDRIEETGSEIVIFADEFGLLVQDPEGVASAAIGRLLDGRCRGVPWTSAGVEVQLSAF